MKITKSQTKLTRYVSPLKSPSSPIQSLTHASSLIHSQSDTAEWGPSEPTAPACVPVPRASYERNRNQKHRYGTLLPADMPITKKIRPNHQDRRTRIGNPAAAAAIPVIQKAPPPMDYRKSGANAACFHLLEQSHWWIAARVSYSKISPTDAEALFFARLTNPETVRNA